MVKNPKWMKKDKPKKKLKDKLKEKLNVKPKDKIKEMGEGYFHIYLDENTIFHEISDYSLEKIIFEIEN